MGNVDDVKRMQADGKSEQEITRAMKQRGVSEKESGELISQAKIKDAVNASDEQINEDVADSSRQDERREPDIPIPGGNYYEARNVDPFSQGRNVTEVPSQGYEGMEPSMLAQGQEEIAEPTQDYSGYPSQVYPQESYQQYQQYQPYQEALSSDLVTEISEQVVNEKLLAMKDKLEAAIDFRTIAETKLNGLHDRLMRVEKIIDALQISLLQKVGEYVNNSIDIKKELEETQKSFKALHSRHSGHHTETSHSEKYHSHSGHSDHASHSGKKHKP